MNIKFLYILFFLILSYFSFSNELKNTQINKKEISFVNTFQSISTETEFLQKYASSKSSDDNELSKNKNLFLGLTIAFGAGACTFLVLGIVFGSIYSAVPFGIDYERARNNNVGVTNWSNAAYAMLAGTICAWSLFAFTGILAVATFILYVMATDLFGIEKGSSTNKKKAMLEISPSDNKMDILVRVRFN